MEFSYNVEERDGICILNLKGNLMDRGQATELLEEVENQILNGINSFIISMEEFKYMNSTGLNTLVTILTKSRKSGGDTVICNLSPKINELLLITKLNTVFTVCTNLENAVRQFSKA
jgi:anti-sigma B factor antagonist